MNQKSMDALVESLSRLPGKQETSAMISKWLARNACQRQLESQSPKALARKEAEARAGKRRTPW